MHRSTCLPRSYFLILTGLLQLVLGVFPAVATPADHLVISEVVVKTRAPVIIFGSPFIEIVNPTGSPVAMDDVYITDGTTAPATFYFYLPLLDPEGAFPGGGVGGDFHARFPAGYVLAAGDSIAISLNGSDEYQEAYGRNPDFELFEDGLEPDAVPELVEAFPGSINAGLGGDGNVPGLSEIAESLILYSWNGTTDLVQDLDYLIWGSSTSVRVDKTGVTVGNETYLADTPVASQEAAAWAGPTFGSAMRRVSADEGAEATSGGNGLSGHDETSENLATTFPTEVGHQPPTANQLFPSAPIFTTGYHTPLVPYEGQDVTLNVTVVDQDEVEEVFFCYSVNGGPYHIMGGTQWSAEGWTVTVPANAMTEADVVAWWCVATNTSTVSATYPAGSPNFAATWTVAADPGWGEGPAKLLLTEISTIGTDQEYIEIFNPGPTGVDLSDYYLTDANYAAGNQFYYRIGEGNPTLVDVGGGAFNDFHARFPDGFLIAPGDTIVISVAGSILFFNQFGFDPDLELFEDGPSPDNVPDMRWIFGDETNNSIINRTGSGGGHPSVPQLTNSCETIIFYHFVTGQDKVTDIDVFTWQDPSSTTVNVFFNKTGVIVGSHAYLPENGTNANDAFGLENIFGNSYQRIDLTEGDQTQSGSNGVEGRDETSEDLNTTFAMMPWDPAGGLAADPDKLLITEVCTRDAGAEFVEIFNPGAEAVDLDNYYLTDAVYSPDSQYYWQIALGNPTAATVGGGAFGDFHAKFPAGFYLAAGDSIVIAVNGSTAFNSIYGFLPDLKLFENDTDDDDIPAMDYIFGDSINNSIINRTGTGAGQPSDPVLINSAETVVLYNWLPGEDRVVDIDVFFWKDVSSSNTSFLFDKSGVTVGSHTYLPETPTTAQTPFSSETDPGFSYHRTDGSEGTQIPSGSNGVDGRDETSENFDGTFQMAQADPARPPESPVGGPAAKLLLTEISTIGTGQEYIEVYNPGTEEVDLSDYYVTDAIYTPGNQVYWRIAEGNPDQVTVGGGAFNDFHARFPDGYSIAAGDTIVITVAGSTDFYEFFGFDPNLELFEDGAVPDTIPDMRWIFGDEINNSIINRTGSGSGQPSNPSLTNAAETVVLYHWVTGEDKVTDIDVFAWKDPSSTTTSIFFNKTGVTIGSHTYLPEVGTNATYAFGTQNSFGNSYHRIDPSEGNQVPSGSNGVGGRDETSEDFNSTYSMMPYDPVRPPEVIIPVEGDWQPMGVGPVVGYSSDAHTWGYFDPNSRLDLVIVSPSPASGAYLIHDVSMFEVGGLDFLDGDTVSPKSDCIGGDYNQDGDLDLYVAKNAGADWIYTNQGQEWDWLLWGLPVGAYETIIPITNTTDASMVDTDLDGFLEIFVNNGEGRGQLLDGRFEGFFDLLPHSLIHEDGMLGSAWCDLDGDRDPDLAYVSPTSGIAISLQMEPRRFETTWLPVPTEGRDIAWADYDNDGDFDFALICSGSDNVIYENKGGGSFDQIPLVQATEDSTTGCNWGDFDNDGFLDLHVTNASGPNVLWHNEAGAQFVSVADTVINNPGNDRGSSWRDLDDDGDLDLYISNRDTQNRLLRNNLDNTNNWLQVSVTGHYLGNQTNHAALGAVVEVEAGGVVQKRFVGGQEAGPGHSPLMLHFGLGSATVVDRITVRWPFRFSNGSFHSSELMDVAVNQRLVIEESLYGVTAADPVPRFANALKSAQPNPFNPATAIGFSLAREVLVTLEIFDVRGRLVQRLIPGTTLPAGGHEVEWRGKTGTGADAPSGVYIYRITAGDFSASKRMVLIR